MKKLNEILKYLFIGIVLIVTALLLLTTVRGLPGNPSAVTIFNNERSEGKPFELSSERSRYGLVMSIVDNHSLQFTRDIAKIALPDLGTIHQKFVSLFAPGVSYVAIPLYILGKSINEAQVGAFSTSALVAFFNFILITIIVKKITGNVFAGLVGALTFTFGTVAWPYSGTLYEHHYSVFLLLSATLLIMSKTSWWKNLLVGLLFGLSIFIEYPGGIFFLPLIFWLISKHIEVNYIDQKIRAAFYFAIVWLAIGFFVGIAPSLVYNKQAYGNPFQLSGTLEGIRTVEGLDSPPIKKSTKTATGFFHAEYIPRGMDVLLVSSDRGLLVFSPVILLGIFGLNELRKKNLQMFWAFLGIVLTVLIFFSLWGDPWGGWAFGPRYLIPALAFLGLGVGIAVNKYRKNIWFSMIFFVLFIYSCAITLLGALTTLQIPPSTEYVATSFLQLTYLHNLDLIKQGVSGSFIYNTFLSNYIPLSDLAIGVLILITLVTTIAYLINSSITLEK